MMEPILEKALIACTFAHGAVNQRRKYTNEPYRVHPIEVCEIVDTYGGNDNQKVAALLHDVLEDTQVTKHDILVHFGPEILSLVLALTDVSKPEDGNRKTRKAVDRKHIEEAPAEAQFIKCADLISNTTSIALNDPEFAKVYMAEKRLVLDVMKIKDTEIWKGANKIVVEFYENE